MAMTYGAAFGPFLCLPAGSPTGRTMLVQRSAGDLCLTFDIRRQQQQEAVATITLIFFVVASLVVLSVSMADAVDRQARAPLPLAPARRRSWAFDVSRSGAPLLSRADGAPDRHRLVNADAQERRGVRGHQTPGVPHGAQAPKTARALIVSRALGSR